VLCGDATAARTFGADGLRLADLFSDMLVRARISAALGLLELSLGDPAAARSRLADTARLVAKIGVGEPGIVPFVPDLVEALVGVGELEAAAMATAELEEQGRRLARRLAIAGALRCRGIIAAARGDLVDAIDVLEAAREETTPAGQPFELARTLLVLGRVQRRLRQRGAARETLTEAVAIFDRLGARLWSEEARSELARIGGRAASSSELTPSERRIAELVAEGRTNKEVAATLVVADRTVESALTQIYRKLGVRSRTQLARKLTAAG
jgi:DNA-binding CsgD family transcriptional regulator